MRDYDMSSLLLDACIHLREGHTVQCFCIMLCYEDVMTYYVDRVHVGFYHQMNLNQI
jgi:hypothetical protein